MDLGLSNRTALVMGGTKGLGRSIADALAEEGAALTISGRDQGRLDEVAAALRAKGATSAIGVVADVASGEAMDQLADAAVAAMGGVDILVLNHGGPPQCTASEMTEPQLVEWFQHIVVSPIRIANKLLPAMRAWLGPHHRRRQHRHATADSQPGAEQHPARLDLGLAQDDVRRSGKGRRDHERPGPGDDPYGSDERGGSGDGAAAEHRFRGSVGRAVGGGGGADPGGTGGGAWGVRTDGRIPGQRQGRIHHWQHDPGGRRAYPRDGLGGGIVTEVARSSIVSQ